MLGIVGKSYQPWENIIFFIIEAWEYVGNRRKILPTEGISYKPRDKIIFSIIEEWKYSGNRGKIFLTVGKYNIFFHH